MSRLLLVFLVIASSSVFSDTIISDSQLRKWGYITLEDTLYHTSFCDGSSSVKKVDYQSIKSLTPVEGYENTYYRFTLARENYNSSKLTAARHDELMNPVKKTSKHSKLCNIRKSFFVENEVFFVHTDAGMFVSELNRIFELVRDDLTKP